MTVDWVGRMAETAIRLLSIFLLETDRSVKDVRSADVHLPLTERTGSGNQSGRLPLYMIASSPHTLPQFLSGIFHFFVVSKVDKYNSRITGKHAALGVQTAVSGVQAFNRICGMVTMHVSLFAASAGYGDYLDDEKFEMMEFPANTVPDGAQFAVPVDGDRMEPLYKDGQLVWVQQCTDLNVGDVGLFVVDGHGYIKTYDE